MQKPNSRIDGLKELLGLEEQRAKLQRELDTLSMKMSSLQGSIFGRQTISPATVLTDTPRRPGRPPGPAKAVASATPTAPTAAKVGRGKRMKRGALKEQIFSALQESGSAGVRVTELAKALGIKPVNIHSWFHSALNRFPQIKKLTGGHYRLNGSLEGGTEPARGQRGSAARKATKPSTQPAQTVGKAHSSEAKGHSRRGELSSRVLAELEAAGSKGITVKDLSAKIGAPYKNIYIWFAQTGKKNTKIKKLGPAQYRLS